MRKILWYLAGLICFRDELLYRYKEAFVKNSDNGNLKYFCYEYFLYAAWKTKY